MRSEIQEKIDRALDVFECSFINRNNELILHKKWNVYFMLDNIESAEHFDYKMISYLSFYTASHHFKATSKESKWAWNRIDRWFRKEIPYEYLQAIYQKIGCGANKDLGIMFIKSGLNDNILLGSK